MAVLIAMVSAGRRSGTAAWKAASAMGPCRLHESCFCDSSLRSSAAGQNSGWRLAHDTVSVVCIDLQSEVLLIHRSA